MPRHHPVLGPALGVLLLLGSAAGAIRPAAGPAPDPDPRVIRQGGDTVADAVAITMPHVGTGSTVGYTDDYDEVCPYGGSTSPDVVYTLTPAADRLVSIDLQGSDYDTKVYVYDQDLALVACNDDFYPDYVSRIDSVLLVGGVQYYVVIDGYGGAAGEYVVAIDDTEPCELGCPAGAELEGEPPLVDDYEDAFNGGCQFPQFGYNFSPITQPVFCGVSGWYLAGGSSYRDNDYFRAFLPASGVLEITGDAEYATYLFELTTDCDNLQILQTASLGPCQPGELAIHGEPGAEVWLFVIAASFEGPVDEYRYVLQSNLGPVPTTPRSWSAVKRLFD